jgi:hypothetical protein
MTIQNQLDWLTTNTTVLWVERYDNQQVVSGTKIVRDRFERDQGTPISFSEKLEPIWQKKFNSFGDQWDDERQKYRMLYDTMRSFFVSFVGLRLNKVASIESKNISEKMIQGEFAGSYLIQLYMSGKKSLDIITKELQIPVISGFDRQFSETRNKLFEHNYDPHPRHIPDLILDPSVWEVISTKSIMPVYIHTNTEREFEAYIDYYQDYYELEKIFVDIVNNFS